jgi:uncharacterized repeat protein (TIGR01451 family)
VVLVALTGAKAAYAVTGADLGVTQGVSNATPNVGDTVTFTVTLTNHGPASATTVTLYDKLPSGLNFVSASPSQGSYAPATGVWTVGTLTNGASATLGLQATVTVSSPRTNIGRVLHSGATDPNAANNSSAATETPQLSDLGLSQVVSNAKPNVGDTITFTVTLTDKGPKTATNVAVTDSLPAGFSFVFASPSQGSYSSGTGVWTVGTVMTSAPQTLSIGATVIAPTPPANKATITHADQFDPSTLNNTASATVHPQQADLRVTQTVDKPHPNVGDTVTFTITLLDAGPSAATNVQVDDLLPAGISFNSATPSQGSYSSGTGVWNIGAVAYGSAKRLLIQGTVVSPNPATNTATVSHSDQFDPNSSNNGASTLVQPQLANLAIAQFISDSTPSVGDTVLYTLTLTNAGQDAATHVTVSDFLPAGLTLVSATASRGTYTSGTGTWTVGTLSAGTAVTLALHVHVASSGTHSNTATVSHSDQFDPDVSNNSATLTISV